jgi:hypothetical protein
VKQADAVVVTSTTHPFKVSRNQRIAAMKEQKKGKA